MEHLSQTTREQMCQVIVEKIIPEAKKEALQEFKLFSKYVINKLEFSANDEAIVLTNLLTVECTQYEKYFNVKDFKTFKSNLVNHFIKTTEVYDSEKNFNEDGYNAQRRGIMEQFLRLKRIDYLKKLIEQKTKSEKPPQQQEKIKWKGKPSEFGFFINELIINGYIEPPLPNKGAKTHYKKQLAKLCFAVFSILNLNGTGETSEDNLYEELKKSSINDPDSVFFKITRPNRKK